MKEIAKKLSNEIDDVIADIKILFEKPKTLSQIIIEIERNKKKLAKIDKNIQELNSTKKRIQNRIEECYSQIDMLKNYWVSASNNQGKLDINKINAIDLQNQSSNTNDKEIMILAA